MLEAIQGFYAVLDREDEALARTLLAARRARAAGPHQAARRPARRGRARAGRADGAPAVRRGRRRARRQRSRRCRARGRCGRRSPRADGPAARRGARARRRPAVDRRLDARPRAGPRGVRRAAPTTSAFGPVFATRDEGEPGPGRRGSPALRRAVRAAGRRPGRRDRRASRRRRGAQSTRPGPSAIVRDRRASTTRADVACAAWRCISESHRRRLPDSRHSRIPSGARVNRRPVTPSKPDLDKRIICHGQARYLRLHHHHRRSLSLRDHVDAANAGGRRPASTRNSRPRWSRRPARRAARRRPRTR